MNEQSSVKEFLADSEIHQSWVSAYRTKENEPFFNMAFDKIVSLCHIDQQSKILDAGCGTLNHAVRLAKKGYHIMAVDFSKSVLDMAEQRIEQLGLQDKIILQQEDLTDLSFEDNSFDMVYSWGVLLHIPDAETAIKELCRVVKPGGYIIISEGNKNSVEAVARRFLNNISPQKKDHKVVKNERGIENFYNKGDAVFFVRQSNIKWLERIFLKYNALLLHRLSGQFTELYTSFKKPFLRKIIHAFNNFYFKYIKAPHLALGNILIFKKT